MSAGACGQTTVLVYVTQRSGVSGGLSSSTGSASGLMGVGVVARLSCDARPYEECEPFEHVLAVATLAALSGGWERWHGSLKELGTKGSKLTHSSPPASSSEPGADSLGPSAIQAHESCAAARPRTFS